VQNDVRTVSTRKGAKTEKRGLALETPVQLRRVNTSAVWCYYRVLNYNDRST